jgi:hypothetical protein
MLEADLFGPRLTPSLWRIATTQPTISSPTTCSAKSLHWQIPDTAILYREAIPFLRFRDPPTALDWFILMTDLVWLWVVYRVDSDAVFGAIDGLSDFTKRLKKLGAQSDK